MSICMSSYGTVVYFTIQLRILTDKNKVKGKVRAWERFVSG